MRKSKIITMLTFVFISNISASSLLHQSDVANVKIPSPFVENGIKYTTPALQGMAIQNIDIDYVRRAIEDNSKELRKVNTLEIGNLCMLFRRKGFGMPVELSSIWRNE